MTLLASLRIGYRDYQVQTWPSKTAQTHGACGLCDPVNAIIYVSEDRTGYDAADTLLHEILHAIFHMADIDAEKDGEERIVSRLAPMMVQVWRDNSELRKWLNGVESPFAYQQAVKRRDQALAAMTASSPRCEMAVDWPEPELGP